jgi:hypothetical protein
MAANYPTDTPRGRMLGASWNFDPARDARDLRARRRREKAGWTDPKDYEINPEDDIDLDTKVVHNLVGERITNAKAWEMSEAAERRARMEAK